MEIKNPQQIKQMCMVATGIEKYTLVKNTHGHFLAASDGLAHITGFKDCNDMVGLEDKELKCPAADFAHVFKEQDELVLNKKNDHFFLETIEYHRGNVINMFVKKTPLYYQKSIIGIFCQAIDLTNTKLGFLPDYINGQNQSTDEYISTQLQSTYGDYDLSQRESECLYYLLRGRSNRHIGLTLNIAERTVEDTITRIRDKFCCESKSQIIEKCINEKLIYVLPKSINHK